MDFVATLTHCVPAGTGLRPPTAGAGQLVKTAPPGSNFLRPMP
jgi:hypothetical protein